MIHAYKNHDHDTSENKKVKQMVDILCCVFVIFMSEACHASFSKHILIMDILYS